MKSLLIQHNVRALAFISIVPWLLAACSAGSSSTTSGGASSSGGTTQPVHEPTPSERSDIAMLCDLGAKGGCADGGSASACVSLTEKAIALCPIEVDAKLACRKAHLSTDGNICTNINTAKDPCSAEQSAVAACLTKPVVTTTPSSPNGEACPNRTDGECTKYSCACANGRIVNSSFCLNGQCQKPEAHCEASCQDLNFGKWTGSAGGGPSADTGPSTPLEAFCARDMAAGCKDSSCVGKLSPYQDKCPSEFSRFLSCASSVPVCTSVNNCAAETDAVSNCASR